MKFGLLILAGVLVSVAGWLFYLKNTLSAPEVPVVSASSLITPEANVAMIFAHDDDYLATSGVLTLLVESGATISYLCVSGYDSHGDTEIRRKEMLDAANILGLHDLSHLRFTPHRNEGGYMPMPKDQFNAYYKMDSMKHVIEQFILTRQPEVIFTLDNEIGGYGHPEHVAVSQLVIDVCREHLQDPGFGVKAIYQTVFPDGLERYTTAGLPVYEQAKKVYQVAGMPAPDFAVDVRSQIPKKLRLMRTHASQHRNIRKFFPHYHTFPTAIYGWIFDKEYFRKVEVWQAPR